MRSLALVLGLALLAPGFAATIASGATFIVTNTGDAGPGSLRDAIGQANSPANPGFDSIQFAIPGGGVQTIRPLSQLPQLTDPAGVAIDGLTQPGASAGGNPPATAQLLIDLDGAFAGAAHGLWIVTPHNHIQGLVIRNFQQSGIRVQGTQWPTALNTITVCFIGTDPTGTMAQGNGWNQQGLWGGVEIVVPPGAPGFAHDNLVDSCLLSCNYAEGLSISNCPPGDVFMNHAVRNLIGTDVTGMNDLGNQHCGVYIGEGAHDNHVVDNVISGNDFQGVSIVGYAEATPPIYTNSNFIEMNRIGVAVDQVTPLANTMDGVAIGLYGTTWYRGGYAEDNNVMGNTIAHNGRHGVVVWEHWSSSWNADHNWIATNSIYANTLLGIDLDDDMVTPNDPGDPDVGANEDLNMPVISSAVWNAGFTTVTGWVDVPSPTGSTVEVFRAQVDPTGFGEGRTPMGATTPDAAGNWSIVIGGIVVVGDQVTATVFGPQNDTSEFAQCVPVTTANQPPVCAAGGPYTGTAGSPVVMNGGGSYDPDGSIVAYAWQFGDGGTGAGASPTHTYTGAGVYTVTLTVTDNAGATSSCSTWATINPSTGIADGAVGAHRGVWLADARPNPFVASTSIRYELAASGHVSLVIYDIAGRAVRVLVDAAQGAAEHAVEWDGTDASGRAVASGVYLARLETGGQALTRKLLVQ